ncbi:carboxypeptidase regulatory-like domain-containing protein [Pseudomonadota bacterium]
MGRYRFEFFAFLSVFISIGVLFLGGSQAYASEASLGSISGSVKNEVGEVLVGGEVLLLNDEGISKRTSNVDASGDFTFTDLEPGNYYLLTNNFSSYVDEIYPDEICGERCYTHITYNPFSPLLNTYLFGDPVSVVAGEETTADFVLGAASVISGRITDKQTGSPIAGARVSIVDAAGRSVQGINVGDDGYYTSSASFQAGDYYLYSTNTPGYLDEAIDGCAWGSLCNGARSTGHQTPVSVGEGATISNVNFSLRKGASFSGRVIDAVTEQPVVRAQVHLRAGETSTWMYADQSGNFEFSAGLPAGKYTIVVSHDDFAEACIGGVACDKVETIDVVLGQHVGDIEIALKKGGQISGRIIDKKTGDPVLGATVSVYSSDQTFFGQVLTDADGDYLFDPTLNSGQYTVCASKRTSPEALGYLSGCMGIADWCKTCTGSPEHGVNVITGKETSGVDIALTKAGAISGTVKNADTDQPVTPFIAILGEEGMLVEYIIGRSDGTYFSNTGLLEGTYYLAAFNYPNRTATCFGDIPCGIVDGKIESKGNPVQVTEGEIVSGIDFNLSISNSTAPATIWGRVTDSDTGAPIAGAYVNSDFWKKGYPLFSNVGEFEKTDALGRYIKKYVFPGETYLRTSNTQGYFDVTYGNQTCIGNSYFCKPEQGNAVTLVSGEVKGEINFSLKAGPRILGSVVSESTGEAIDSQILVYDSQGNLVTYGQTTYNGVYSTEGALLPGTYYVRTANKDGYVDEFLSDIAIAGVEGFGNATPLVIPSDGFEGELEAEFILSKGTPVRGKIIDALSDKSLDGTIEIYDANGKFVMRKVYGDIVLQPAASLPKGRYYIVARMPGYDPNIYGGNGFHESVLTCADNVLNECELDLSKVDVAPVALSGAEEGLYVQISLHKAGTAAVPIADEEPPTPSGGGGGAVYWLIPVLAFICAGRLRFRKYW